MIPKIIHYCWFGRNPLPDYAKQYIASWRKYLPDYEIKEWNEDNFDVNRIPYTREAYKAKKYAFVSDYARFWILYHYGGIYFDTDVEVIRNMDAIILKGPFMGIENVAKVDKYETVNAGLGLGAEKGMDFYKRVLDNYAGYHFFMPDGTLNLRTIVQYVTVELVKSGLKRSNDIQQCAGIYIYPKDYFNPKGGGIMKITENTRTIHQYSATWVANSNGISDAQSWKFKWNMYKAEFKHFLKKYTIFNRNRLVITNNYLSECYQTTFSIHAVSPFAGGWISDDDYLLVDQMIHELELGTYHFIDKGESKYSAKIFYDYPILKFDSCGAEVHYENKDSIDDVKVQILNVFGRLHQVNNLIVFVTNDMVKANKFLSDKKSKRIVVSSSEETGHLHVADINLTQTLNPESRKICRLISKC